MSAPPRPRIRRGWLLWGWKCGDPECNCLYGYLAVWDGGVLYEGSKTRKSMSAAGGC